MAVITISRHPGSLGDTLARSLAERLRYRLVERRELILHEAASRLGVSKMTVVRLIRDGLLPAKQVCVGAPYVIREDDLDQPAIRRAIENGRAVSPDARQESLFFQ